MSQTKSQYQARQKKYPQIVVLRMTNDITRQKLENERKDILTQPKLRLVEAQEHEVVVEAPVRFCNRGHPVQIEMVMLYHKPRLKLTCTAKVVELHEAPMPTVTLVMKLVQHDEKVWKQMHMAMCKRQMDAFKLFKQLKGTE